MSPRETGEKAKTDAAATDETAPAQKTGWFARRRSEPLLPEAGAGGAPLTAVIGVMSFLAVLAMAAALIINQSTAAWTADLRSEITIQVKGATTAEIDAGVAAARRVLADTPGVEDVVERSREDAAALLEPWLGRGNVEAFLNVPALIEVKAGPALRADLDLLRTRLAAAAPQASLDDHAAWHDRLATAARAGQALAFAVFLLVMGAACAVSIFAARAGLAANHEIVSVLHLVGATDAFIAAEVQRRFFVLGFRGAFAGLAIALATLGLVAMGARHGVGADSFLPQFSLGGLMALTLVIAPLLICLAAALTARITVLRALREQY